MKVFTIIKNKTINEFIKKIIVLLFWILIWQLIYICVNQHIIIPSPLSVFKRLTELIATPSFFKIIIMSMFRIILGFLTGIFIGTTVCILSYCCLTFKYLLTPVIHIITSTPVVSFIIIALVWIKSALIPIFISSLIVIPIVWGNLNEGISKVNPDLIELSKIFYKDKLNALKRIYIPSVFPFFISACSTAIGLAWKAGVASEIIANTKNSIGGKIYDAKIYIEITDLFAWTITIIIMSIILEYIIIYTAKKLMIIYNN